MKTSKIFALIFALFLMGSATMAQNSVTRTPGNFTSIEAGGSFDVYISLGSKDEVRLESNNFSLDKVLTEVEDDRLKIKLVKGNHHNVDVKVYVTVRELYSVGGSGSGNIYLQSDIKADKFSLGVSGSGVIKTKTIHTGKLAIGISGSGDIFIEGGYAEEANIGQSGSGELDALSLDADRVKVAKSGSGTTAIGAKERLSVASSGSGNVYYRGNPSDKSISSSGSSRVIQKQ